MQSHGKDLKGETLSAFCLAGSLTAAGTGDNTQIVGSVITIGSLAQRPSSVVFEIAAKATLTTDKTLIVTGLVEVSADNSNWTTEVASATLITLTATGSGMARIGVDLVQSDLKYIRLSVTPDLSHSGTDTAIVAAVAVFGGLAKT